MGLSVHLIIYAVSLILVLIIFLYEWMYLKELVKVKRVIGVRTPAYMMRLLKINLAVIIGSIGIIMVLIIVELL